MLQYSTYYNDESNGGVAKWHESDESWYIPQLDFAGNNIKPILTSVEGAHRPESDYARLQKDKDPNPRYRQQNVIQLGLEKVGKISQNYDGNHSENNVKFFMEMDIDEEHEKVTIHNYDVPGNPYLKLSVSVSFNEITRSYFTAKKRILISTFLW